MIRLDHLGQELWHRDYKGGDVDWGWGIIETCLHDLLILGSSKFYGHGLFDMVLMKTDEFGAIAGDG